MGVDIYCDDCELQLARDDTGPLRCRKCAATKIAELIRAHCERVKVLGMASLATIDELEAIAQDAEEMQS